MQPRDEQEFEGQVYPTEVRNAGRPGEALYDAAIRELTSGSNPSDLETAEFMVTQDWDRLWPEVRDAVAAGHNEQDAIALVVAQWYREAADKQPTE